MEQLVRYLVRQISVAELAFPSRRLPRVRRVAGQVLKRGEHASCPPKAEARGSNPFGCATFQVSSPDTYPFSEANIDAAVRRLADRIPEGVVRANERMTDDLMLGVALPQTIGATSREWPFKFIDWSDWRANTFQVTSEYTVSEAGGPTIRVDLMLFVNGIPLGVIEVKASHVSSDQGVSQQIRNQKTGEGVPALFYSAQLLLAANSHDPRYGKVPGAHAALLDVFKSVSNTFDAEPLLLCGEPLDAFSELRFGHQVLWWCLLRPARLLIGYRTALKGRVDGYSAS